MTRTTKTVIIVLSTSLIASSAYAFGGGKGERMNFDQIDSDGNGTISQAELNAMSAAHFAQIDSDGNGSLSLEELQAMGPMGDDNDASRAEFFLRGLDADNSGDISPEEMAAMGPGSLDLASADKDGDGELSKKELRNGMKGMRGERGERGEHGKRGHDDHDERDDHEDDDH